MNLRALSASADDYCTEDVMTLTLKYRQFFLNRLFANMPAAAREAYDHANTVFASAVTGEVRIVPATVTIETSAGVNRPQEQPKNLVNEMVAAMRRVRGLDR